MCKVTCRQLGTFDLEFIRAFEPPIRLLYLERESVLEQAVSEILRRLNLESHPIHTFIEPFPEPVTLDPLRVAKARKSLARKSEVAKERLRNLKLPMLRLTYEEITGGREATQVPEKCGQRICGFLEVPYVPLYAHTRKIHKDLKELILNWDEVKDAN